MYLQYNENKDVVIPASSLDDLVKIIENINGEINITIKDKNVLFKFNNILFQSRILEGNYPDTSRLIPNEFLLTIKFDREELLQSLDRV